MATSQEPQAPVPSPTPDPPHPALGPDDAASGAPEPAHEPFQEDLYVLTTDDARENPVAPPAFSLEDIIILEDDAPAAGRAPEHRRRLLPLAAAAAALLAAIGASLWLARTPSAASATGATAAAPAPPAKPPAAKQDPAPAAVPERSPASTSAALAPVTGARTRIEPSRRATPPAVAAEPRPTHDRLERGTVCAVLLRNGRFFEGTWLERTAAGDCYEVPDGHVVVADDEGARIFVRGTAEFARLTGERRGWVVTHGGTRHSGAIYILDEARVVVGTDDERVEFARSELREVRVTHDVADLPPALPVVAALR